MQSTSGDLNVSQVLADPMIRAVMRADRVEAGDLEALLAAAALRLNARRAGCTAAARAALLGQLRGIFAAAPAAVRSTCG